MLSGWLIVNKPLGITSAHVVGKVKRMLPRGTKIGHGGTLDPLACGVLPLAIGEATKLSQFLIDSSKEYEFEVSWGEERATDDAEGEVTQSIEHGSWSIDINDEFLSQFRGEIEQVPPQYSAIKMGGKRAYDMARSGEEFEIKSRKVTVYSLDLIQSPASSLHARSSFRMSCSKGTYVRSLARDMGRKLGCYGYVSGLKRLRHGQFGLGDAITLENLEEMCKTGALAEVLLPPQKVLDGIPALSLSDTEEAKIRHGIALEKQTEHNLVALYSGETLVAIASPAGGKLQPIRVFNI